MNRRYSKRERLALLALLALFFLFGILTLTRYPFVHSDESWLAGLTRAMMEEGSPAVTEPFFDLKPRWPHAIKILFHLLQTPVIAGCGYSMGRLRRPRPVRRLRPPSVGGAARRLPGQHSRAGL